MTLDEKKGLLTVVLSDNPTAKEQELANWLTKEWEAIAAEEDEMKPSLDEGKPKTPLPEEEDSSSAAPDFAEDFLLESDIEDERSQTAAQTHGFLTGLISGWLVIGVGFLTFLAGRKVLGWLAELLDVSPDILIGVSLLFVLAMMLRRKAKEIAKRLAAWLTPEF